MPALAAIGAIAGIASAGVGVASAAGAFNPSAPNAQDILAQQTQAQINLEPQITAADQNFGPQQAAVNQQINYNNLFGTPGGTQTVNTPTTGFRNTQTGAFVAGATQPFWSPNTFTGKINTSGGNAPGGAQKNPWVPFTQDVPTTVTSAATPGELQMAEQALPTIDNLSNAANTSARTATIADVQNLGPAAMAALRGFDPAATGISDTLASQAQEELDAGSQLTPSMIEQGQQNVRAGQAARGLGVGPTDAYTEAFTLGQAGQNLLEQRQAFAGNVVNQRLNQYGDPFLAIADQSSGRNVSPTQFGTPASSPSVISQVQPNSQLVAGTINAGVAGANQQNSSIGALAGTNWGNVFSSVGQLFGGVGGSGAPTDPAASIGLFD